MNYIDIYNNMENPLDNEQLLDELAEAYKNRNKGMGGFYGRLVRTTEKKYSNKYMIADSDKFHADAFNKWKKGLLSLTKEELDTLIARHSFDNRIYKLIDFLKNIPDVKTEEEARNILYKNITDNDLESAIEDYCWNSIGAFSGWTHVSSRYFDGKRGTQFGIEHRLYLNTEGIDTYKVVNEFIKKCDERQISYYFKFDDASNRDDSIVIYSDTEKLPLYVEVLQEIAKENPDIRNRCQHPPILTGKIDDWIGYGTEPSPKNGKNRSFNDVRSKCLEKAIETEMDTWIQTNKDKNVNYHGKTISMIDYITLLAADSEIESMKRRLTFKSKNKTQQEHEMMLGYDKAYIARPEFRKKLVRELKTKIQDQLNNVPQKGSKALEIPLQNGKTWYISNSSVKHYQDLLVPDIMKNDLIFRKKVLENIKKLSEAEEIDVTKYCFDKSTKQKLIKEDQDKASIKAYYEEAKIRLENASKQAPRRKNKYETNKQYLEYLIQFYKTNLPKTEKTNRQQKIQPKPAPKEQTKHSIESTTSIYHLTKDEIIQDLPINSKQASRYNGAMTEEEIRASQIKLGFISKDVKPDVNYNTKKQKSREKAVTNNEQKVKQVIGMTDEEIRASQIKLGFISPDMNQASTYRLKKNQIIQDLPINSKQVSRYNGAMTDTEIKAAQKKIGTYPTKKRSA